MKVTKDDSVVLTCLGLGSCVGMAAYDPVSKVAGMAHIVLPRSDGRSGLPAKFADTAIPALVDEMCKLGALQSRLVFKIAGGAHMSVSPGAGNLFKTGERNVEATKELLAKHGLRLVASDTGGSHGRTLCLSVGDGRVTVTTAGTDTKVL